MERDVIEEVRRSLRAPRRRRDVIARELRAHLEEAQRDLELAGWHPDDAAREGIARLGDPTEIAERFSEVYRPPRRSQVGLALALAGALLLGLFGVSGSLASATSAHQPAHVQHHSLHR